MPIKPIAEMIQEANAEIDTWTQDTARERYDDADVQFVDIRDIRELWRDGTIPGSLHAPRGMLEFWINSTSPYAKEEFQQDKTYLLFCASGWRSALAAKAIQEMGFSRIAHIDGGYSQWKKSGHPTEEKTKPKAE